MVYVYTIPVPRLQGLVAPTARAPESNHSVWKQSYHCSTHSLRPTPSPSHPPPLDGWGEGIEGFVPGYPQAPITSFSSAIHGGKLPHNDHIPPLTVSETESVRTTLLLKITTTASFLTHTYYILQFYEHVITHPTHVCTHMCTHTCHE